MIEPGGSRSSRNAIVARATSAGSAPSRVVSSFGTWTRQVWLAPPTVAPTWNSRSPRERVLILGMHGMLARTAAVLAQARVDKVEVVHARDATRVEVVLQQGRLVGVEADDRDAVWGVWVLDLPPLNEEASARQPLENGTRARSVGRVRGERGDHAPRSDEDVERR